MDHKTFELSLLKASDGADAAGYFAVFNNIDSTGDRILPGAFANLPEFLKTGAILYQHTLEREPIGYPVSAVQDNHGLKVAFNYHDTPRAQAVRTTIRERLAKGLTQAASIGYKVLDSAFDYVGGRRVTDLKKLQLFECSPVLVGANDLAHIVSTKASDGARDLGKSPEFWAWARSLAGQGPLEQNDVEMLHTLWLSGQRMPGDNPYVARQGQTWRGDVAPGVAAGNGTLPPGKAAAIRLRVALLRADLAMSRAKLQAR